MKTEQLEVKKGLKSIAESPASKELRIAKKGESGQQGDVYIHPLPANWQKGKLLHEGSNGEFQVAVGTGNGARHMASGKIKVYEGVTVPPGFKVPERLNEREMLGPVIESEGPWQLKHPEHAWHEYPAGIYGITYQYDPRTMRRTLD